MDNTSRPVSGQSDGTTQLRYERPSWEEEETPPTAPQRATPRPEETATASGPAGDWPKIDPALIQGGRGKVPPFPVQVLSPAWREWVFTTAEGTGAPIDYVAQGLLACVAGVTGCGVQAEATASWREPLVLWMAAVGAPSTGKTPALTAARQLIDAVERGAKVGDDVRQREHETKVEATRIAAERWRTELADAAEMDAAPPVKPAAACFAGPFVPTQIVMEDTTIESVVDVVRGNPQGVILWRDELSGWLQNLARYNGGNDRPFWLERWSAGSATVNRKSRPPVYLPQLGASIIGGIQPDRLEEICADTDDGMVARFLYTWPDRPPYKPLQQRQGGFDDRALTRLRRISGISGDAETPRVLTFDSGALRLLDEFCAGQHDDAGNFAGLEAGWFGKGRGHVVRLAAMLTLLAWSECDGQAPRTISTDAVRDAADLWADYFWPVARNIFSSTGTTLADTETRKVVRWLKKSQVEAVSREDLRVEALGRKLKANQIDELIERLVDGGVLRPAIAVSKGPGRPASRWEVNPALRAGKAEAAGA